MIKYRFRGVDFELRISLIPDLVASICNLASKLAAAIVRYATRWTLLNVHSVIQFLVSDIRGRWRELQFPRNEREKEETVSMKLPGIILRSLISKLYYFPFFFLLLFICHLLTVRSFRWQRIHDSQVGEKKGNFSFVIDRRGIAMKRNSRFVEFREKGGQIVAYFPSIFTKDHVPLSLTGIRAKCQASLQLGHPVDEGKRLRANVPITTQEHKDSLPQFSYCDRLRHVLHPLSSLARARSLLLDSLPGRSAWKMPREIDPDRTGEEIREAWDHAARIKGWTPWKGRRRRGWSSPILVKDGPRNRARFKEERKGEREREESLVCWQCAEFSFRRAIKKKNNKVSRLVRAREKCEGARGDCATSFKGFSLLETWLYISTSSDQLRYRSLV